MCKSTKTITNIKRKIIKTSKNGIVITLRQIDVVQNPVLGTTTIYVEYYAKGKIRRYPLKLNFNLTQDELMYLVFEGEEKVLWKN